MVVFFHNLTVQGFQPTIYWTEVQGEIKFLQVCFAKMKTGLISAVRKTLSFFSLAQSVIMFFLNSKSGRFQCDGFW